VHLIIILNIDFRKMSSKEMQVEFFKTLTAKAQAELVQSYLDVMKEKPMSTPGTPPANGKRLLQNPESPYQGRERKVIMNYMTKLIIRLLSLSLALRKRLFPNMESLSLIVTLNPTKLVTSLMFNLIVASSFVKDIFKGKEKLIAVDDDAFTSKDLSDIEDVKIGKRLNYFSSDHSFFVFLEGQRKRKGC
jgi:hypothetical protein